MKHAPSRKIGLISASAVPRGPAAWIARRALSLLASRLRGEPFRVRYWDGTEEQVGKGPPAFCLTIRDPSFLRRLPWGVDLAFGEAYMDGRVEVDDLDALLRLAARAAAALTFRWPRLLPRRDPNAIRRQYRAVRHHYDVGDAFFALWLDASRTYSCAYFETPDASLEEAQQAKRRHILRKLRLRPGQTLLDIGCGWGSLLFDAAREYGVYATGITLANGQYAWVRQQAEALGLSDRVRVEQVDYRELLRARDGEQGAFDRVVSVGMFEHVGRRHLPDYMAAVARLLKPGGLSLLHTITRQKEGPVGPWLSRYIFPGGYVPSWRETVWLLGEYGFELLDVESLRPHYALTLDHWSRRFEACRDEVRALGYDERFLRMWRLYLRGCAAGFRYGDSSVHQFLVSRGGCDDLPLIRDDLYRP